MGSKRPSQGREDRIELDVRIDQDRDLADNTLMLRALILLSALALMSATLFGAHARECHRDMSGMQPSMADMPCHGMGDEMSAEQPEAPPPVDEDAANCCCPAVPGVRNDIAFTSQPVRFVSPRTRIGEDRAESLSLAFEPPPPKTLLL